jgi:hypothetical protein
MKLVKRIDQLFNKKWHIATYEIEGQSIPPPDGDKDDFTIFLSDNSVKTVNRKRTIVAKWEYDMTANSIKLYPENSNETTEMKIFHLNDEEFVWETTNPEGLTTTIHMSILAETT